MSEPLVFNGLVLRSWSGTVSLFSQQEGRIERKWYQVGHRAPLHRGSFISYTLQAGVARTQNLLMNVELERCGTLWAIQDMYLFHALLEACYYFIPLGSDAQQAYTFLMDLFDRFHFFSLAVQKKMVLCKFFTLLGMYPDDVRVHHLAAALLKMPIDNLVDTILELNTEELMNQWLSWCIEVHPKGKFFKAMPLLLEK